MKITMNYRKYFKEYYGIDFSKEYEVHHIDLNRENNDIRNLMLLPKTLHRKYHMALSVFNQFQVNPCIVSFNVKISGNGPNTSNYQRSMAKSLLVALEECDKWYDYKSYLDGEMPNIHNITLD